MYFLLCIKGSMRGWLYDRKIKEYRSLMRDYEAGDLGTGLDKRWETMGLFVISRPRIFKHFMGN